VRAFCAYFKGITCEQPGTQSAGVRPGWQQPRSATFLPSFLKKETTPNPVFSLSFKRKKAKQLNGVSS